MGIRKLLNHPNIDPNIPINSLNETTLYLTVFNKHTDIVKALLNHPNMDPNIPRNLDGKTPLSLSVEKGHTDIAKAYYKITQEYQFDHTFVVAPFFQRYLSIVIFVFGSNL